MIPDAIMHEHVLALSIILFVIGLVGFVVRRNLLVMLMSVELMLNAANLALVGFGRAWAQQGLQPERVAAPDGQVFALLVMTVAAAEIAVGLAILIALVRNRDSVDVDEVSLLRW